MWAEREHRGAKREQRNEIGFSAGLKRRHLSQHEVTCFVQSQESYIYIYVCAAIFFRDAPV